MAVIGKRGQMQLVVKGKQMDVGDALRIHVQESLESVVGKYFRNSIDATVVMSKASHGFRSQVSVHVGRGLLFQGHAESDAPYGAFDLAAEHVAKQLRRHKRRIRDHRDGTGPATQARYAVLEAPVLEDQSEGEAPSIAAGSPLVIAEMATEIATLTVGEAAQRLDIGNVPALLFRNSAHGRLNMVYRRSDGHLGWVDPAAAA